VLIDTTKRQIQFVVLSLSASAAARRQRAASTATGIGSTDTSVSSRVPSPSSHRKCWHVGALAVGGIRGVLIFFFGGAQTPSTGDQNAKPHKPPDV